MYPHRGIHPHHPWWPGYEEGTRVPIVPGDGVQAFAENHVHRFTACTVSVLDDFRHHPFEYGTPSLHSSDVFWCFQAGISDHHAVLVKSDTPVVCPSVAANKFGPAGPTRPAMYECSQTCMLRRGSETFRLSHDLCLIVSGSHTNSIQIEKRIPTESTRSRIDSHIVIERVKSRW